MNPTDILAIALSIGIAFLMWLYCQKWNECNKYRQRIFELTNGKECSNLVIVTPETPAPKIPAPKIPRPAPLEKPEEPSKTAAFLQQFTKEHPLPIYKDIHVTVKNLNDLHILNIEGVFSKILIRQRQGERTQIFCVLNRELIYRVINHGKSSSCLRVSNPDWLVLTKSCDSSAYYTAIILQARDFRKLVWEDRVKFITTEP